MTPMFMLLVAWGILTGILIILWIYKSTLTMHEDDSIFLLSLIHISQRKLGRR